MFMGEYHHSIDVKGRLIIPSKLRDDLGDNFIVTRGLDGCLFLYPQRHWNTIINKYKELPDSVVRQRLINMIHYVADMHCPSHCGFPERIHLPASKYNLKRNGKFANFHSFWDGSIGAWRKGWTLKKYVEKIDNVLPNESKKWQKGLEQKDLQKGIDSWGKGIIKRAHRAYAILPEGTDLAKLTNEQKAQVHELADESILIGGYRLAYVLNTIFKE